MKKAYNNNYLSVHNFRISCISMNIRVRVLYQTAELIFSNTIIDSAKDSSHNKWSSSRSYDIPM